KIRSGVDEPPNVLPWKNGDALFAQGIASTRFIKNIRGAWIDRGDRRGIHSWPARRCGLRIHDIDRSKAIGRRLRNLVDELGSIHDNLSISGIVSASHIACQTSGGGCIRKVKGDSDWRVP